MDDGGELQASHKANLVRLGQQAGDQAHDKAMVLIGEVDGVDVVRVVGAVADEHLGVGEIGGRGHHILLVGVVIDVHHVIALGGIGAEGLHDGGGVHVLLIGDLSALFLHQLQAHVAGVVPAHVTDGAGHAHGHLDALGGAGAGLCGRRGARSGRVAAGRRAVGGVAVAAGGQTQRQRQRQEQRNQFLHCIKSPFEHLKAMGKTQKKLLRRETKFSEKQPFCCVSVFIIKNKWENCLLAILIIKKQKNPLFSSYTGLFRKKSF